MEIPNIHRYVADTSVNRLCAGVAALGVADRLTAAEVDHVLVQNLRGWTRDPCPRTDGSVHPPSRARRRRVHGTGWTFLGMREVLCLGAGAGAGFVGAGTIKTYCTTDNIIVTSKRSIMAVVGCLCAAGVASISRDCDVGSGRDGCFLVTLKSPNCPVAAS